MSEVSDALFQFLSGMAEEVKANIPSASGRTAAQISVEVNEVMNGKDILAVTGYITGPDYIETLEHGRGPTKGRGQGTMTLQQSILGWLYEKGIRPQDGKSLDSLSWAISIKIHQEGNKLFRNGGRSGVLSNVLTASRGEMFLDIFNQKYARLTINKALA